MPLRKSMRVNTLKTGVDTVQRWGRERGWQMTPVPWCAEAFFIDREDRTTALGKDLLHLLGHVYMQEAASMLPVALLHPQPGEVILDMSAAPGSKTTQIAAALRGSGVIVANDVQEKRLWTLKAALHRCGVPNVIVTKKVGQWFSKHMTERFDRVLCDAPCTAQGTVRKDSDALAYCSLDNIEKMARLQYQLLEAAVHSAKVGGRIVYSTCTLTPEENEGVVRQILNKFFDQLTVVSPDRWGGVGEWDARRPLEDSAVVQRSLGYDDTHPFIRLWPQTEDTEGFFCAVLEKTAPTRAVEPLQWIAFQEERIARSARKECERQLVERYGVSFLGEGDCLYSRGGESLILTSESVASFGLPVEDYAIGMPFGKRLKDGRVLIDHELATLRGQCATQGRMGLSHEQLEAILAASDIDCPLDLRGHTLLFFEGTCIGIGLAKDGRMKNNLPRWMVRFGS